jgi:NAD(P)-dependent dehydrogenase (short-subunit alcohol dehydrogenase family)
MRSHGIPEAVATSHTSEIFGDFAERTGMTVDELLEGFSAGTMLKRLPKLSDIADFAAFAASDRASVMTGEIANLTAGTTFD